MMRIALFVFAAFSLMISVPPARAATLAVFVGIDRYANSHTHLASADKSFQDLEDSVTDVALFKAAMAGRLNARFDPGLSPGGPSCSARNALSTTLSDRCATRSAIIQALAERVGAARRGDLVLFLFSGLGSGRSARGGGVEGTIVPADGRGPGGEVPDIAFSEIVALQRQAELRGARLFSVLEAATPTDRFACDRAGRSLPMAPTRGMTPSDRSTDLDGIALGCDGNPSEESDYSGSVGNLEGVLTHLLNAELKMGRDPWTITPSRSASGIPMVLIGGFAAGSTPHTLLYLPPMPGTAVTGGVPAVPGEAPFIVELHKLGVMKAGFPDTPEERHGCDGSLIARHWVLTAAHCLEHGGSKSEPAAPPDAAWIKANRTVRLGSSNLDEGMFEHRIMDVIWPDDFCDPDLPGASCEVMSNDIALLRLDDALVASSASPSRAAALHRTGRVQLRVLRVATIDVAGLGYEVAPTAKLTLFGWGAVSQANSDLQISEAHLRKALLTKVDAGACASRLELGQGVPDGVFCAGSPGNVQDACQGDSGGPVVIYDAYKVPLLVGVVSEGATCATEPGLYTEVSKYRGWINRTMRTADMMMGGS